MIRIIARPVPWPSLGAGGNRAGLRLRWDALRSDTGEVLAEATEHPEADGAFALRTLGVSGDVLVTMRHEGSPHDSFLPVPLDRWAERGRRLAENRAKAATLRSRTAERAAEVV